MPVFPMNYIQSSIHLNLGAKLWNKASYAKIHHFISVKGSNDDVGVLYSATSKEGYDGAITYVEVVEGNIMDTLVFVNFLLLQVGKLIQCVLIPPQSYDKAKEEQQEVARQSGW